MSYLKYKEYLGTIEPDMETGVLFGKLAFIKDTVTYEATTLKQLEDEFKLSVDEYLESCLELGREAHKPCKGSFNIRIGGKLHRKAAEAATDIGLNTFVKEAIEEKLLREHYI
jgi:predicted HicB family RNase H-like nuclease